MRRSLPAFAAIAVAVSAASIFAVSQGLFQGQDQVQAAENPAANPQFYTEKVKPIFSANCASCHEGLNRRGGLNIETRASLLKGGHDGAAIIPGDAVNSLLVRLIRHEGPKDDPMSMPPRKPKISDADIAIVSQWIAAGAVMPETPAKP
jgi:cytochrome c